MVLGDSPELRGKPIFPSFLPSPGSARGLGLGEDGLSRGSHSGFFFFFFFFVFLGPYPRHIEVPGLGVKLELQLPAIATATAMQDLSCICDLRHSLWQCWILNPLSETRDQICILMNTSWVPKLLSHNGNYSHSRLRCVCVCACVCVKVYRCKGVPTLPAPGARTLLVSFPALPPNSSATLNRWLKFSEPLCFPT